MHLKQIGFEAHAINAGNGWEVFSKEDWPIGPELEKVRFIATHIALIHSEVSEALEGLRNDDRANFDEELADIIIRVASVAHGLGTDLEAAVTAKLVKNAGRGFRHGGKAV